MALGEAGIEFPDAMKGDIAETASGKTVQSERWVRAARAAPPQLCFLHDESGERSPVPLTPSDLERIYAFDAETLAAAHKSERFRLSCRHPDLEEDFSSNSAGSATPSDLEGIYSFDSTALERVRGVLADEFGGVAADGRGDVRHHLDRRGSISQESLDDAFRDAFTRKPLSPPCAPSILFDRASLRAVVTSCPEPGTPVPTGARTRRAGKSKKLPSEVAREALERGLPLFPMEDGLRRLKKSLR
uniref:Uncharacterized protein n=1 Tax=Noctiluca scintillans TaxID=2966 RepID=A0A7S1FKL3_NOCSC|mmetsp:Transcript_9446/g.26332  ORF Transcript_9446/g.26332 Transcript_9446/m.26332 type:complete len:245 (+) Transcript_9446:30-764(+)